MIIEHRSEHRVTTLKRLGSISEEAWSKRTAAGNRLNLSRAVAAILGLIVLVAGLQMLSAPSSQPHTSTTPGLLDSQQPVPAAPR